MNEAKQAKIIAKVRAASKIVAEINEILKAAIKPGISLLELDSIANKALTAYPGATAAFKNYEGFPNSICASVNDVLVHGVPTNYCLKTGDVISIDFGVKLEGYYGDGAFTIGVGIIDKEKQHLITTTREALAAGIKAAKTGNTTGDIGYAVEQVIKKNHLNLTYEYIGHGIGNKLHLKPAVPNYGQPGKGIKLTEGMTICIEPMVIVGDNKLIVDKTDNWTVRTKDGSLTAHEEHTIVVRSTGGEILTI